MTAGKAAERPVVVITGETASGKSALAMHIARRYNGEIICADAWTVYTGFDIGTAKPSQKDRQEIAHHVLDVVSATMGFSAPQFKDLCQKAVNSILSRGKLPIIVGGAGLYVDAFLYDYSFLPVQNTKNRDVLNTMTISDLLRMAHARGLDTSRIDERNKRRIIRLIENNGAIPSRKNMRESTCLIGLRTDKLGLEGHIRQRVEAMLLAGLEAEVGHLADVYGWQNEPMKGIGYREWRHYFAGTQSLEQTKELIVRATLRLAKKQRTWFRRNGDIQWFDTPLAAEAYVAHWLAAATSQKATTEQKLPSSLMS